MMLSGKDDRIGEQRLPIVLTTADHDKLHALIREALDSRPSGPSRVWSDAFPLSRYQPAKARRQFCKDRRNEAII
jgi:hypothetical protein